MIYLGNFVKISETKSQVFLRHNRPDTLDAETLKEGVLVETIPQEVTPDGKFHVGLFINPTTKELWHEYADIPPVQPTKESIEKGTFTKTLAQLTIENKKKDVMITQLAQQVSNLNIEINKMKEGTK